MKLFGLIGYPLSHSFSPGYFKEKFEKENIKDCAYDLYSLENISQLKELLQKDNLKGLNVTIPYKEKVFDFLDEISPEAEKIGAVNTIKIEDGKITGYNTDVYGFEKSIDPLLKDHHLGALILGTGGAAKAVAYVLDNLFIQYKFVSRSPRDNQLLYSDLNEGWMTRYKVIINTSPLGLAPNIDTCPNIPYEFITKDHLLYDLIYNPAETLFMLKGKEKGAIVKNGFEMLELQADRSWEIWGG